MSRIMALDLGDARIGIAMTDPERIIASAHSTLPAGKSAQGEIARLVREQEVEEVVIGLPISLRDHENEGTRKAREFGESLEKRTGAKITYYDERYTTIEAERILRESGVKGKKRRGAVDRLAAQILLASYLRHLESRGA